MGSSNGSLMDRFLDGLIDRALAVMGFEKVSRYEAALGLLDGKQPRNHRKGAPHEARQAATAEKAPLAG